VHIIGKQEDAISAKVNELPGIIHELFSVRRARFVKGMMMWRARLQADPHLEAALGACRLEGLKGLADLSPKRAIAMTPGQLVPDENIRLPSRQTPDKVKIFSRGVAPAQTVYGTAVTECIPVFAQNF